MADKAPSQEDFFAALAKVLGARKRENEERLASVNACEISYESSPDDADD